MEKQESRDAGFEAAPEPRGFVPRSVFGKVFPERLPTPNTEIF